MSTKTLLRACMTFSVALAGIAAFGAEDLPTVKAAFAQPAKEYSTGPLWVWNDDLTDEQIVATLQSMASQRVMRPFVHPRPGLMTPYLSDEWFRLWQVALDEAERLGMDIWIYDENSYPSGFAGGWVPELMPESRGTGLVFREEKNPGPLSDAVVAVFRAQNGAYVNVTQALRGGKDMPEGEYLVARTQLANGSPWFGGKWYVDLLKPGVTEKFLEVTLGAYEARIGQQFGKRIPGSFTDEPHLAPAGGLHWTEDLPAVFEKRWGYSLIDVLPSLTKPVGPWKQVRHNYFQVLLHLFIERWAKPYYEYCTAKNLEFTGHYWEHGWPGAVTAPDNMAMGAWQHRPGIDILFNQYDEGPHAQFGNVRAVLELASVANQTGKARTLCETYGGSGWDMRFEDLKRIGDWVSVLGVNTINEHLSHITLRGARKADYPVSFSYHTPWWEAYHVLEDYFTRVSYAITRGAQINPVLLLEPTTTAWMYQGEGGGEMIEKVGNTFQKLVTDLAKAQVEFDIGCEDIIARHGAVSEKQFIVGERAYTTVVLPPEMENINAKTLELLTAYATAGGQVICCETATLACVDGHPSDAGRELVKTAAWTPEKPEKVAGLLLAQAKGGFLITRAENDGGILYHQRRQLPEGDLLFLVNTSITAATAGTLESPLKGVERWDLHTGEVSAYPFGQAGGMIHAVFTLPPCGSMLLFLSKEERQPASKPQEQATDIAASGPVQIAVNEPNVLTLDYVDVTAGGESKRALHFHKAAEFVFQKNGLEHNPWDHAVQFSDELIRKTFPAGSGFEATYRFIVEGDVPKDLAIVLERTDLYDITCNGHAVSAEPGRWWMDRAFGKIDLAGAAVTGENAVTLKASAFSMFHEIAPAYILGDFRVKAAGQGFVIVPSVPLSLGAWQDQGMPFYGHLITYTLRFPVDDVNGKFRVTIPDWYGAVAKISVNGKPAGYAFGQPTQCDVSSAIVKGDNTIEVGVFGTLKNTLGPHHGNPPLGIASPGSFRAGPETGPPPGEEYSTIGYGLFAPFVLERLN